MTGYGSRIKVNNTFDERLRILEEKVCSLDLRQDGADRLQMLPEVREKMFGRNENVRLSLCISDRLQTTRTAKACRLNPARPSLVQVYAKERSTSGRE